MMNMQAALPKLESSALVTLDSGTIRLWIARAIANAGVDNPALLNDLRFQRSLQILAAIHLDRPMKNDPDILSLSHAIWIADRNFRSGILHASGIDPFLSAFCGLHHDTLEEIRDICAFKKQNYNEERIYAKIKGLWNNDATFPAIKSCIAYMTDAPGINKASRISEQYSKSFDSQGHCKIGVLEQITRFHDKLHQIIFDTGTAQRDDIMPLNKITRAIEKAEERLWVCDMPAVPRHDKGIYYASLASLKIIAAMRVGKVLALDDVPEICVVKSGTVGVSPALPTAPIASIPLGEPFVTG